MPQEENLVIPSPSLREVCSLEPNCAAAVFQDSVVWLRSQLFIHHAGKVNELGQAWPNTDFFLEHCWARDRSYCKLGWTWRHGDRIPSFFISVNYSIHVSDLYQSSIRKSGGRRLTLTMLHGIWFELYGVDLNENVTAGKHLKAAPLHLFSPRSFLLVSATMEILDNGPPGWVVVFSLKDNSFHWYYIYISWFIAMA